MLEISHTISHGDQVKGILGIWELQTVGLLEGDAPALRLGHLGERGTGHRVSRQRRWSPKVISVFMTS